ncbi:VanZ family protein [Reichenbachiella carrageenanivorans]|uniref:VanZ family protein n=1 Tax=Reichenbachiella carrageenanivorans TaxID=2979869 RepID=UPI00389A8297
MGKRIQRVDREIIPSKPIFKKLALGWTGAILFATLSPTGGISLFEISIPHFDKVVHFGLFFVYALWVGLAIKPQSRYIYGFCIGSSLAILTEWLQSYVPGRQADIYDGLADVAGTIVGLFVVILLHPNSNKKQSEKPKC